jgi:hypothetical protein
MILLLLRRIIMISVALRKKRILIGLLLALVNTRLIITYRILLPMLILITFSKIKRTSLVKGSIN